MKMEEGDSMERLREGILRVITTQWARKRVLLDQLSPRI